MMYDSLDQAMYNLVHDFPGGAKALAAKANMNAGTLQHKVNPTMDTHHLTVKEAITLMLISGDYRLLHALCHELDHACLCAKQYAGMADAEFLNHFSHAVSEFGDMARAIHGALDDGKITASEVRAVRRETLEAISAMASIPARLEAMSDG